MDMVRCVTVLAQNVRKLDACRNSINSSWRFRRFASEASQSRALLAHRRLLGTVSSEQHTSDSRNTDMNVDGRVMEFNSDAFRELSTTNLLGCLAIFSVCKIRPVVSRATFLISSSTRLLGKQLTNGMIKQTFFAYFCGGENLEELNKTVRSLQAHGVGTIFDYAAEMDVSSETQVDENVFDENMKLSRDALQNCAIQPRGYVAVKVSSLGSANLLQKASVLVLAAEELFRQFSSHVDGVGADKTLSSPRLHLRRNEFVKAACAILAVPEKNALSVYQGIRDLGTAYLPDQLDGDSVSVYGWKEFFSPNRIGRDDLAKWLPSSIAKCSCIVNAGTNGRLIAMTDIEFKSWLAICGRMKQLSDCAMGYPNVSVLIDAEQTYLQPAIHILTLREQQRCNGKRAVVYNTYQAYLRDTQGRLVADLRRSDDLNYRMGVKLVRGAYMKQERELCQAGGYDDPINNGIAMTHVTYDICAAILVDRLHTVELILGSHNENSVLKVLQICREKGIPPHKNPVGFAQLKGMCNHVTYTLGSLGYSAWKYVPYGPVDLVIPYLLRRADENSSVLSSSTKEMKLIAQELLRRTRVTKAVTWLRSEKAATSENTSAAPGSNLNCKGEEGVKRQPLK